jgi:hypothetical protein
MNEKRPDGRFSLIPLSVARATVAASTVSTPPPATCSLVAAILPEDGKSKEESCDSSFASAICRPTDYGRIPTDGIFSARVSNGEVHRCEIGIGRQLVVGGCLPSIRYILTVRRRCGLRGLDDSVGRGSGRSLLGLFGTGKSAAAVARVLL